MTLGTSLRRGEAKAPHRRKPMRGFILPSRAGDRARTGDPQLGKLMLYQLSYARVEEESTPGRPAVKDRPGGVGPRETGLTRPPPARPPRQFTV